MQCLGLNLVFYVGKVIELVEEVWLNCFGRCIIFTTDNYCYITSQFFLILLHYFIGCHISNDL